MSDDLTPGTLVPELLLADPEGGRAVLERAWGFRPEGGALRLGDQRLLVGPGTPDGRHGRIDHLALAVPDLPAALAEAKARGARLAAATPDGPVTVPEFGARGASYAFLEGPEGANVELMAQVDPAGRHGPGHEHVGLSCAHLAPMRAFLLDLGGAEVASHVLRRPGGDVEVCFVQLGGSVVEVYSLPETRADPGRVAGEGFWRLRMAGLDAPRQGPEGVEVRPL